MESIILNNLSRELQITPELIIRESWEMKIIKELAESKIGPKLVFKGGTAMRLAYNSPRFSEDLDFDLAGKLAFADFKKEIKKIVDKSEALALKDLAKKYYTYLAQISIRDDALRRPFSIKLEVSTRTERKSKYFEPKLILSPVTSEQALFNVARLKEIKKEKLAALKSRKQARDLFDLWFIAQLNREAWVRPASQLKAGEVKRELNKFLPRNFQGVIKELI